MERYIQQNENDHHCMSNKPGDVSMKTIRQWKSWRKLIMLINSRCKDTNLLLQKEKQSYLGFLWVEQVGRDEMVVVVYPVGSVVMTRVRQVYNSTGARECVVLMLVTVCDLNCVWRGEQELRYRSLYSCVSKHWQRERSTANLRASCSLQHGYVSLDTSMKWTEKRGV